MLNYNFPQSRELMIVRDTPLVAKDEEKELFYSNNNENIDANNQMIKALEYQ